MIRPEMELFSHQKKIYMSNIVQYTFMEMKYMFITQNKFQQRFLFKNKNLNVRLCHSQVIGSEFDLQHSLWGLAKNDMITCSYFQTLFDL